MRLASAEDAAAIARHLAEKGATKCPPATPDTIDALDHVEGARVTRRWRGTSSWWRRFRACVETSRDYLGGDQGPIDAPDPVETQDRAEVGL